MTTRRGMLTCVRLLLGKPTAVTRSSYSALSGPSFSYPKVEDVRMIGRRVQQPLIQSNWREVREMSCCAGLGSPPPREIVVEYSSEEVDYTDEFIKLANAIEEAYPEFVVSGNPDAVQPRNGAFEIIVGDSVLFSKLKLSRLPELSEVLRAIDALPPPQCELSSSPHLTNATT